MEDTAFFESAADDTGRADSFVPSAGNVAGTKGAQTLSDNFDSDMWALIEQKISANELAVLRALVDYANGLDPQLTYTIESISDKFYRELRSKLKVIFRERRSSLPSTIDLVIGNLVTNEVVQEESTTGKKVKKPKIVKLTKVEEIRLKQSTDKIKSLIEATVGAFKGDSKEIPNISFQHAMNSSVVEIKGIGLLYACAFLDRYVQEFNVEKNYAVVFDIMATVQKFINICINPLFVCNSVITKENIRPSEMMIEDLRRWLVRLKSRFVEQVGGQTKCVFNWENIQKYAPQIFIQSQYQHALPRQYVKLKNHQKGIIDAVRQYIDTGAWGIYDAMIGSGKTTSEIGIAALIGYLRMADPSRYRKLRFLSVCNSESVRYDVAQKCYAIATEYPAKKLHFAIGYIRSDNGKLKISKNNACEKMEDVVTVIASPEVAKLILEENEELDDSDDAKYQYIMFVDEPNMGADRSDSRSLYWNVAVNHVSPYITIMSSATFPSVTKLGAITNDFFERHPTAEHFRVYSDEITIGCDIKTFSGSIVVPHLGATTPEQLSEIINCVAGCSFLGKAYTPTVVDNLYNKMLVENIPNLPNVPQLFEDVDNLDINRVRATAMQLLTLLASQSSEIIQRVCSTTIGTEASDDEEDEDEPVSFSFSTTGRSDDTADLPLDLTKLGTTQAYRMLGQTLIAHPNPERFVIEKFGNLIQNVYDHKTREIGIGGAITEAEYKSTGDALKKYNTKIDIWKKKIVSIERNATSPEDKADKLADHDKIKPKFPFPTWAHVNTADHVKTYALSHVNSIVKEHVRCALNVPYLADEKKIINVSDEILTALFCGVGIYSTETVKCKNYLNIVLHLASIGALAYLVADSTIVFGTNYPFYNCIITEEFSVLHSMLVLFQLMGRAGRPGKSSKALIYVPDSVAMRIINFVNTRAETDPHAEINIEPTNMIAMFNRQKEEIANAEQRRIDAKIASLTKGMGVRTSGITVIKTASTNAKIVPISDVPDGNLKSGSEQMQVMKNGNWRDTRQTTHLKSDVSSKDHREPVTKSQDTRSRQYEDRPNNSRQSNSSEGWTRGAQISSQQSSRQTENRQDSRQSGSGTFVRPGGKYVPPALRGTNPHESNDEKPPRHRSGNSSSSSGWRKDPPK